MNCKSFFYILPLIKLNLHLSFIAFFLTAHFSEEDFPYDWLMLWLSRRPEWQRSREFETTTRTALPGGSSNSASSANSSSSTYRSAEDDDWDQWEVAVSANSPNNNNNTNGLGGEGAPPGEDAEGRPKTRVIFQPTYDTTHTIFYKGHWLRVRRGRKQETGSEMLSIRFVYTPLSLFFPTDSSSSSASWHVPMPFSNNSSFKLKKNMKRKLSIVSKSISQTLMVLGVGQIQDINVPWLVSS